MRLAFYFGAAAKILANDSEKMLLFLPLLFRRRFTLREFSSVPKVSRRHRSRNARAVFRAFLMAAAANELT